MVEAAAAGRVPEWTVADRLRKARESAGMQQGDLARSIGVSRNSVSNYESARTTPRRIVLNAWAMVTGVPVEWLETGRYTQQGPRPDDPDGGLTEGVRHQGLEPRTRWLVPSPAMAGLFVPTQRAA